MKWRRVAALVLPLLVLVVAGWELNRQFAAMDWIALRVAFLRIGAVSVLQSVLTTAASFMGLAMIETWAVHKHPSLRISTLTAMVAGAASHAIGHVLGWHAVIGVLIRRKAYSATSAQVVDIVVSVGAAVFAGVAACLAIASAAMHSQLAAWLVGGALVLVAVLGSRGKANSGLPTFARWMRDQLQRTAAILPIAALESAACLAALWFLLPAGTFASWPVFAVTCLLAQAAGVVSHVPGGLGVFEAAMLASVPAEARPGLLAAILAYRVLYGLLPFVTIGVPWLLWSWLKPWRAGTPRQ